jgi:hypothetical protein
VSICQRSGRQARYLLCVAVSLLPSYSEPFSVPAVIASCPGCTTHNYMHPPLQCLLLPPSSAPDCVRFQQAKAHKSEAPTDIPGHLCCACCCHHLLHSHCMRSHAAVIASCPDSTTHNSMHPPLLCLPPPPSSAISCVCASNKLSQQVLLPRNTKISNDSPSHLCCACCSHHLLHLLCVAEVVIAAQHDAAVGGQVLWPPAHQQTPRKPVG